MRAKREKTEFGSVKAVIPRSKKAVYGDVVAPTVIAPKGKPAEEEDTVESIAISEGEATETTLSSEGVDSSEVTELPKDLPEAEELPELEEVPEAPESAMDKLEALVEAMEDYGKEKALEKEEEAEKEEESSAEENQKEDEKLLKEDAKQLSKYLNLQMKIRALGDIFGAVRTAEVGKEYYSYCAVKTHAGYTVFKTPVAQHPLLLCLAMFPYFKTQDEAEAFLELCEVMLKDYGVLAYNLDAGVVAAKPLKVTGA